MGSFELLVLASALAVAKIDGVRQVMDVNGEVNIALLIHSCRNLTQIIPHRAHSLTSSAAWVIQRVNFLDLLAPVQVGLSVYEVCNESDYYKTIFELYQQQEEKYLLGVIATEKTSDKIGKFCDVLDIRIRVIHSYNSFLAKAAVKVLAALGWTENVTILAPEEGLMREFHRYSKREFVCVRDCLVYGATCPIVSNFTYPLIFFGYENHIEEFVRNHNFTDELEELNVLFVPLDGSVATDLPDKSYVILPPHGPPTTTYKIPVNIFPTPLLLEVARPILTYVKNAQEFLEDNCNETIYKINCLKYKFSKKFQTVAMTPSGIMDVLKVEPLQETFVYDIYRVESDARNLTEASRKNNFFLPFTKMYTYAIFDDKLSSMDENLETLNSSKDNSGKCVNYFSKGRMRFMLSNETGDALSFRNESWVFAFLSLSLLGVLFCISILMFLLISIFRRDILEGNPILTLALLLSVMLLFCSVLPFSLESNKFNRYNLCIARSLAVTLGYSAVLSLLLSRCILLATASKELGFMSHIAGSVQSFLCLFIFGVQAALSLQLVGRCENIFRGYSFIYLMSYNVMLLLLLLCLCPLIYKCQRNYREGKYFAITIALTAMIWSVWMPCYAFLGDNWKEPMLCLGLVSTAAVFLGAVFIPRTYLMTIAAARDKITSALPSLATANSTMDIYRANTQPIYDCVNIAAINAVAVARAGVAPTAPAFQNMQQPDLYTCPALPDEEDYDFRCDTPPATDKITRF